VARPSVPGPRSILRLLAYRIGIDEVLAALRASNQNVPAGFYTDQDREYVIQGLARLQDVEDIARWQ